MLKSDAFQLVTEKNAHINCQTVQSYQNYISFKSVICVLGFTWVGEDVV